MQEADIPMLKALVVDDEAVICEGLKAIIDWEQYDFAIPDTSGDAYTALDLLEKEDYDLVFTDICMPMMNGLELIKSIYKKRPECSIVIISGYKDFEYAHAAIKYGVLSYLLKPINENELINTLISIKNKRMSYIKTVSDMAHHEWNPNTVSSYMLQMDTVSVSGITDSFFHSLTQSKVPMKVCKYIAVNILKELLQNMSNIGMSPEDVLWNDNNIKVYLTVCDIETFEIRFKEICCRIMDYIDKKKNTKTLTYIKEIKEYVEQNCCSQISVKSLAEHFYLNPAYLGRKFKEYTGDSVNDYLNSCRIARAKELLTNSKSKIMLIYMQVGYSDLDTYYLQFKRITGMNPTQYRALLHPNIYDQ
jgi:two-component system response regulator YesN